jgi:hypothetical protein
MRLEVRNKDAYMLFYAIAEAHFEIPNGNKSAAYVIGK